MIDTDYVHKFINNTKGILNNILESNKHSIIFTLLESFQNIFHTPFNFKIILNYIELYNNNTFNLNDFDVLEELIKNTIEKLVTNFFELLDYKIEVFKVSELICIDFSISGFPMVNMNKTVRVNERIGYIKEGYSTGKIIRKINKKIEQISGKLIFKNRKIKEFIETYFCINDLCTNKNRLINKNDINYIIDSNKVIIKSVTVKNKCNNCKSDLIKDKSMIKYEYFYYLTTVNNEYIQVLSNEDLSDNLNNNNCNIIGYFIRNFNGNLIFILLSLNFNLFMLHKSSINKKYKIEEKVKELVYWKSNITKIDITLFLIFNIFNIKSFDQNINNLSLPSSPISGNNYYNNTNNNTMLILTNDINYILPFLNFIVKNVKVFYSLKTFINNNKFYNNSILILEKINRKNCANFNYEFCIKVEHNEFLEYDYYYTKKENIEDKYNIKLTSLEEKNINEFFIELRNDFKGIIEPYRLLRTIEALYLSIKGLIGEGEIISTLRKYLKIYLN